MHRRELPAVLALLAWPLLPLAARAGGLAGISDVDASKGLRSALEKGALAAVQLLGRPDGFLANPQVHIPLPKALQDVSGLLKAFGLNKQLEDLEVSMNRAAEQAVPMAKNLLVNAVHNITVADAKRSYGRTLLLVRPVAGTGEQWVEESRIRWAAEDDGGRPLRNR